MFYLLNGDITFDMITQAWALGSLFLIVIGGNCGTVGKSAQAIDTIPQICVTIYGNSWP